VTELQTGQSGASFLARAEICSLRHRVQNGSGAHLTSYQMDTFHRG